MSVYTELMDQFLQYGKDDDQVESILLIGSLARKERPGDAYADIDLIFTVTNPDYFLESDNWLSAIGDVRISFVEDIFDGLRERRVLFNGGIDVDIVILPNERIQAFVSNPDSIGVLQQGYRILLDKTHVLTKALSTMPVGPLPALPSEQDFSNTVKDFWFHLVWATKKLQRGELWAAKSCLDNHMKQKLLWIIECCMHTRKGLDYNTWFGGRYLDFWVDVDILEDLPGTFSTYSSADMLRALTENTVLFRRLAKEAAQALHYTYPQMSDKYATKLIRTSLQQYQGAEQSTQNTTPGGN